MWDIIKQVHDKNRRELTLTGADIDKHPEEVADDTSGLFSLVDLNLLRISKSSLNALPESLGALTNLTNLVCDRNKLETFPVSVGSLTKLTLLDVSNNDLRQLPDSLGSLECLASLNVSCNKLLTLPNLNGCKALALLDASNNQLEAFINVKGGFELLSDVIFSSNNIEELPAIVGTLPCLKRLELEKNRITEVPGNLMDCPKLKVVQLRDNPLKDRRLRKLVENARTTPDQVLKYIKQHCSKKELEESQEEDKENHSTSGTVTATVHQTLTITAPAPDLYVTITKEALLLRPFLVCCLVKGVDLQEERFRKFIVLQTRLHDGICQRRIQSTIATHDLEKIVTQLPPAEGGQRREGLVYTSRAKEALTFVPLNRRSKPVTAEKFLKMLQQEAEAQRKQQKLNSNSGIYKYLQLVQGWTSFPCLLDTEGSVLSVPPLTNADLSKITTESTSVLLEVTSDKSLPVAKETMTQLLQAVMELRPHSDLTVQQVRVQGEDGGLRCVFPASDDLMDLGTSVRVVRPHRTEKH